MKTSILLVALTFGSLVPTYSQINPNRKIQSTAEQPHNTLNNYFGNKTYDLKANLSNSWIDVSGIRLKNDPFYLVENKSMEPHSQYSMPCFHPKSGDLMPCVKPMDNFQMPILNPQNVTWGILW